MKHFFFIVILLSQFASAQNPLLLSKKMIIQSPATAAQNVTLIALLGQSNAAYPHSIYQLRTQYTQSNITSHWKIWNQTTHAFQTLNLGTNNLGLTQSTVKAGPESALLANMANAYPGQDVYTVKVAVGGTQLTSTGNATLDWNPNSSGELADSSVSVINGAKAALVASGKTVTIKIVWAQGEADGWINITAQAYKNSFEALITKWKTAFGQSALPIADWQENIHEANVSQAGRDSVRLAKTLIQAAHSSEIRLINLDGYDLRDPYHYGPDGTAYGAEQSINYFTGVTPLTSTAHPFAAGHIDFKEDYFEEIGDNQWQSQYNGANTASKSYAITTDGGTLTFNNVPGDGAVGLSDNNVNGVLTYSFGNSSGTLTCTGSQDSHTEAYSYSNTYRLYVDNAGVVNWQKSTNGTTWATIATKSISPANYYAKILTTYVGSTVVISKAAISGDFVGSYSLQGSSASGSFASNALLPNYGTNASGTRSGNSFTFSDPSAMFFKSTKNSRDVSIRISSSTSNCVFFRVNNNQSYFITFKNGRIVLGLCTDITQPPPYYNVLRAWYDAEATTIYNITGDGSGTFTIECNGFDITLKCNGVQFYTGKEYYFIESGAVALRGNEGNDKVDLFEVTHLNRKTLYSNTDLGEINLLDWDIKQHTTTTGSISAGSNILTVADASHYALNETLLIEPNTGKGTYGPGKGWPLDSYANQTAMDADTTKADLTYAGNIATGRVMRYDRPNHLWYLKGYTATYEYHPRFYDWYEAWIRPNMLIAGITAINGNQITLDKTSFVTVTNTNVYLDSWSAFSVVLDPQRAFGSTYPYYQNENIQGRDLLPVIGNSRTLIIPSGDYAFSQTLLINDHPNWTFKGPSDTSAHLFTPKGGRIFTMPINNSPYAVVDHLFIEGRSADDDWGTTQKPYGPAQSPYNIVPTPTNFMILESATQGGITFGSGSNNATIRKCKFKNFISGYLSFSAVSNCIAEDLTEIREYGNHNYMTWDNVTPFGVNNIFRRINYTCTGTLTGAFEGFGSTSCIFEDLKVRGGKFSNNSSDGIRFRRITDTIAANSLAEWDKANDYIFNINTNAYGHSADAELDSVNIYAEGYVSNTNRGDEGGSFRETITGVSVQGTTNNSRVKNSSYTINSAIANLSTTRFHAFESTGSDVTFSNLTVNGYNILETNTDTQINFSRQSDANIYMLGGTVTNSHARSLLVTSNTTTSNNTISVRTTIIN